ncbi:OsmC family protein [Sedimenticola sp.]|uniref:OsmC family protein n=1 Tax=Sedimenticola sp. TaxID=1940285 RepID=UPI002585F3FF|nr:OsmC family protein [Sedimenticola sp.]MCW8903267.1 OsmC family protein [Sedimenticola sp.]
MSQASVRTALLNTIEGIKNNPAMSGVVFRADTAWEEDVRCSAKIRDFAPFTIDEPLELGGQDSAANPVELVLVALGTCQEIMYSAYASVMDIPLEAVSVKVRGYLDLKGMFGLDESIAPGFSRITFDTEITSSADSKNISELIHVVENHCPVLDILVQAQSVTGKVKVNGQAHTALSSSAA